MLSETVSLPPQPFKHPRWMATPNVTWHQLPECQESEWQFFCSDVGLHQNRDALAHDLEIQRFLARLRLLALILYKLQSIPSNAMSIVNGPTSSRAVDTGREHGNSKPNCFIQFLYEYLEPMGSTNEYFIFYHSVSFLIGQVRVLISNGLKTLLISHMAKSTNVRAIENFVW